LFVRVSVGTVHQQKLSSTTGGRGRPARVSNAACRALDLVLSCLLLVVLLPLFVVVSIAILLDSPGSVLFRQRRLGRDLEPFRVCKFRTMYDGVGHDAHRAFVSKLIAGEDPSESSSGPRYKMGADERVTRLGRILRRLSIDELPQLWNVVRGEMSLVGPRPPIPYEVEQYPPDWFARFAVKPGVTGLWQVSGRCELTVEQMIHLDIEYVQRRSFWLNVRIVVRTIPVVLSTRGAS
jgi:lipopolysaccharide/colanic/teichoic acid biosynthesis glycosyltransferase